MSTASDIFCSDPDYCSRLQRQKKKELREFQDAATAIPWNPPNMGIDSSDLFSYSTVSDAVGGSGLLAPDNLPGRRFDCVNIPYELPVVKPQGQEMMACMRGASAAPPAVQFSSYANVVPFDLGRSIFAPWNADSIGLLDEDGLLQISLEGIVADTSGKFWGAALTLNSKNQKVVVFPTFGAHDDEGTKYDCLTYNVATEEIRWGPLSVGASAFQQLYSGASTLADGRVVAAPYSSGKILIYNPVTETSIYYPVETQIRAFSSCTRFGDSVLLTPWDANYFSVYDGSSVSDVGGDLSEYGPSKFIGGAATLSGQIVAAPFMSPSGAPVVAIVDMITLSIRLVHLKDTNCSKYVYDSLPGGYFSDTTQLPQGGELTKELVLFCDYNARADLVINVNRVEVLYESQCTAFSSGSFGGSAVVPSNTRVLPNFTVDIACPNDPWFFQFIVPQGYMIESSKTYIRSDPSYRLVYNDTGITPPASGGTRFSVQETLPNVGELALLTVNSQTRTLFGGTLTDEMVSKLVDPSAIPVRTVLSAEQWELDLLDECDDNLGAGVQRFYVLRDGEVSEASPIGSYSFTGTLVSDGAISGEHFWEVLVTGVGDEQSSSGVSTLVPDPRIMFRLVPAVQSSPPKEFLFIAKDPQELTPGEYIYGVTVYNGNLPVADALCTTGRLRISGVISTKLYPVREAFRIGECQETISPLLFADLPSTSTELLKAADTVPFRSVTTTLTEEKTGPELSFDLGSITEGGPVVLLEGSIECSYTGPQGGAAGAGCLGTPSLVLSVTRETGTETGIVFMSHANIYGTQYATDVPTPDTSYVDSNCSATSQGRLTSTWEFPAPLQCGLYTAFFSSSVDWRVEEQVVRAGDKLVVTASVPPGMKMVFGDTRVNLVSSLLPDGWIVGNQGINSSYSSSVPDQVEGRNTTASIVTDSKGNIGVRGSIYYPFTKADFSGDPLRSEQSLILQNTTSSSSDLTTLVSNKDNFGVLIVGEGVQTIYSYSEGLEEPLFMPYEPKVDTRYAPAEVKTFGTGKVLISAMKLCGVIKENRKILISPFIADEYDDPLLSNEILAAKYQLESEEFVGGTLQFTDSSDVSEIVAGLGHSLSADRSLKYVVQIIQAPFDAPTVGMITISIDPQKLSVQRHEVDISKKVPTYVPGTLTEQAGVVGMSAFGNSYDSFLKGMPRNTIKTTGGPSPLDFNGLVSKTLNSYRVTKSNFQSRPVPLTNCFAAAGALPAVTDRNILPCGPTRHNVRTTLPGSRLELSRGSFLRDESHRLRSDLFLRVTKTRNLTTQYWE